MNDTDLLERLATVELPELPHGLGATALRRGRARVRRRRAAGGVGLAAVAAATSVPLLERHHAGPGPSVSVQPSETPLLRAPVVGARADDIYAEVLTGRTRGDLAGDAGYLSRATATWNAWTHQGKPGAQDGVYDHLLGTPHVVWAGSTPAGPAAVVVQEGRRQTTAPHLASPVPSAPVSAYAAVGFIGVDRLGHPRVVNGFVPMAEAPEATSFTPDPAGSVVVVLDSGTGVAVGLQYAPDGGTSYRYDTPLDYRDGAAVLTVPAGRTAIDVHTGPITSTIGTSTVATPAGAASDACATEEERTPLDQTALDACIKAHDPRLPWTGVRHVGAGAVRSGDAVGRTWDKPAVTLAHGAYSTTVSGWYADGTTADGTQVTVGERRVDHDPSRALTVLTAPDGTVTTYDGGVIDRTSPLPIHVHLPHGQGWVVAAYGSTLTWSGGHATDAALVPDGTTSVTVTSAAGGTHTVPLG